MLPASAASARSRLFAKGRLPPGVLNKTEKRFVDEWITWRVRAGEILWWAFEGVTLKLAPDCRLTVDFFIMLASGELQAWDVKGSLASAVFRDDAKVKLKVAATKFPFRFFVAAPQPKRAGGGWDVAEIAA